MRLVSCQPALLTIWFLLLCPFLWPQSLGELRIEVRDSSGGAVHASGLLESLKLGTRLSFQTTDNGTYVFSNLPFGRYRLQVASDGFTTQSSLIEIDSTTPVTRSIALPIGVSSYAVNVVGATPLAGLNSARDEFPAPIQAATERDIQNSAAISLADFMNRRLNGVYLNEIQNNPMQPDVNYRGYTASPLLGTPQGLSIYMDGVRMNQPFGDAVSWDLIQRNAISELELAPGSNPLFGLNTLGGAISIRTKDGFTNRGTSLELGGGSFGRKTAEIEHGGSTAKGLNWFLASNLFFEDGWRETSPSNVRQLFGKLGWQRERTTIGLTLAYANNNLLGNGLQELRLLNRDYHSIYTRPDRTANRSPFLNLNLRHSLSNNVLFSGNAYFRYIRTLTLNGDLNDDSLDQSVYQPNAAERATLIAAGYSGFPTAGENAANTPFPSWRCIAQALLRDEPGEKCNGLLNRSGTHQRNYGLSGQVSWFSNLRGHRNQITVGAAYDGNSVGFTQSTELGYLNPDRGITGVKAYADGVTGGNVDGEPLDNRVDLSGRIRSQSVYATDTISLSKLSLTLSGRYNHTSIDNRDRLKPAAGIGSLTGKHTFDRFNPAVGATYKLIPAINLYAGYTEGNRAPTAIELGCADPNAPCKLPNAMVGDPPLKQVVARTVEAGIRSGSESALQWSAGFFRASNRDDILFVASQQTGFGYFKNFGKTLRQGAEVNLNTRIKRLHLGGGYTFLDATFQSAEELAGAANSSNFVSSGTPGLEGDIEIAPGNRIPLIPQHMLKAYADLQVTSKFLVDLNLFGLSSSYARGNENNLHKADGRYYLGPGKSPGYAVVNLSSRYQIHTRVQLFVQVNNLFDRRYYTAAQLGATGFTATGNFIARPFPAVNGVYPLVHSTFFAPGAPRGAWGGIRVRF